MTDKPEPRIAAAIGYSGRREEPEDAKSQEKYLDRWVREQLAAGRRLEDITPAETLAEVKRFRRRFIDGRKKHKHDKLAVVIIDAFAVLGLKASAKAVRDYLRDAGLITVDSDGSIDLIDGQGPNYEFRRFEKRTSRLRQKLLTIS